MTISPDDLPQEITDLPKRPSRPRPRLSDDQDESPDKVSPIRSFEPSKDLPGAVFMVPNCRWGFESATSDDHPGACAHYQESERQAILVKGTDADNVRYRSGYYFVQPSAENGLDKLTAFELVPCYFRLHRIRLFYPERHLGRLDDAKLFGLCEELARLHPAE